MINHKMRVKADKYKGYQMEKEEMMKDMSPEMKKMMGEMKDNCIPVDLYGKRTITEKSQSPTLEEMGEDIKEVYGLEDY